MATTSKSRKAPSSPLAVLDSSAFVLTDFRVVVCGYRRLIDPAEASKGSYKVNTTAKLAISEPNKGEGRHIVLTTNTQALGTRATVSTAKSDVSDRKSFQIDLETESLFLFRGAPSKFPDPKTLDVNPEALKNLVIQTNPLVMSLLRDCARNMGYAAVRPYLGSHSKDLKVGTA